MSKQNINTFTESLFDATLYANLTKFGYNFKQIILYATVRLQIYKHFYDTIFKTTNKKLSKNETQKTIPYAFMHKVVN